MIKRLVKGLHAQFVLVVFCGFGSFVEEPPAASHADLIFHPCCHAPVLSSGMSVGSEAKGLGPKSSHVHFPYLHVCSGFSGFLPLLFSPSLSLPLVFFFFFILVLL